MVDIFDVSYTVFKEAAARYTVYYYDVPESDGYVLGTGNGDVVYTVSISGADTTDFVNNLILTSEEAEKEGDVLARPTLASLGNLQSQYDLTDDNFIYVGTAKPGVATSSIGWTILRYAKDANGNPIDQKTTVQDGAVWDDRSAETYQ